MSGKERATLYCDLILAAQSRMEKGADLAFNRHHPRQTDACRRMLRYISIIRWLYARASKADQPTALAFRESCTGKPWPFGGIDDDDTTYFRLMARGDYADVTGVYA